MWASVWRVVRRGVAGALAATVLVGVVGVGSAFAGVEGSAWWHVMQVARPAYIAPAKVNEVQEIVERESTGTFLLKVGSSKERLPYGASAAEVQSVLERPEFYGAGNVQVTGGPLGADGKPLFVTTMGELAREFVEPVVVSDGGENAGSAVAVEPVSGRLIVKVSNLGDGVAEGGPVKIVDDLPGGVSAVGGSMAAYGPYTGEFERYEKGGAHNAGRYEPSSCAVEGGQVVSCVFSAPVWQYGTIEVQIPVVESPGVSPGAVFGETNRVSVSGGGAPTVESSQTLRFSEAQVPFGLESYEQIAEEKGGAPDARAGSHPFQFTTSFAFNESGGEPTLRGEGSLQPAQPHDLKFYLPAGVVGNTTLVPQCSLSQFDTHVRVSGAGIRNLCPADTAVGTIIISYLYSAETTSTTPPYLPVTNTAPLPMFNLVPGPGEPARFGFTVVGLPVILDTSVRTGGDYGVTVTVGNTPQSISFLSSITTFWGVPGSPAHDASRGWACIGLDAGCEASGIAQKPFLTLGDDCEAPLQASMSADSWLSPALLEPLASSFEGASDGCNHVPFEPGVKVAPDVPSASSPSGLTVHLHLPQKISEDPEALGEGTMRDATVTLPEGVALNPADAEGLEGCSESEIGYLGGTGRYGELLFSESLPEPLEPGRNFCPTGSKIGTVKIETPLLPAAQPFEGSIYLAAPAPNGESGQNPFNNLLAMYIVAYDKEAGVLVKAPVRVQANPVTGRLTAYSQDIPQLPFEDLELHFFGGSQSPLATPARCGAYTTEAVFEPWSGGEPDVTSSTFDITGGRTLPGGGIAACPGQGQGLPFAPSLTAGMTSNQAGGLSPFTMTMSREDGNQDLQSIGLHMPPGLSGLLAGVKLCGNEQADAGTCGPESQIGETLVSVGVGGNPYTVTGGRVYLTGPYNGSGSCTPGETGCAPFGLSIVNPANAGPFHLGNVIVRAKIEVNPQTAELTVTSDNSGPYKIPTILDGIPLQIQHVNVTINRPGFTFNPTDCDPLKITGSLDSAEGSSSALLVPFQATNCASLKFSPKFSVSTSGKTSKADGASLTAKLSEPSETFGSQANISKVKVELPVQLPSRLTTLQKACTAAQFHTNPAGCPAASIVGHAVVHTPLLPVPLEGPAYFVSNGGEAFPNLIMVLQGYGVTVELVGDTFISKAGITSSTFKTVPDVPFSTFELTLPEQSNSALAANVNLCAPTKTVTVKKKVRVKTRHGGHKTVTKKVKQTEATTLSMPTEFIAQNGAAIHESTPVSVTECAKASVVKAHKTSKKSKRGKKGKGGAEK